MKTQATVVGIVSIVAIWVYVATQAPIWKAKESVANLLIDPSAAQFRNVYKASGWVCGEVNGKNRFGAYVGFRKFAANGSTAYIKSVDAVALADKDRKVSALDQMNDFRVSEACDVTEALPVASLKRTDFEVRDKQVDRAKIEGLLREKGVVCKEFYIFAEKNGGHRQLVNCRGNNKFEQDFVLNTFTGGLSGPFAPLSSL